MCESDLRDALRSKWARKLQAAYPEVGPLFAADFAEPLQPFRRSARWAAGKIRGLKVFGNKSVSDPVGYSRDYGDETVIYCVRHVCEWVAKDSIESIYRHKQDIVPTAIFAARHFIESFLLPNAHHICFEDFHQSNEKVVAKIFSGVGLDFGARQLNWWDHTEDFASGDPRAVQDWWRGHKSSLVEPIRSDTVVHISGKQFWPSLLGIYQPYYDAARAQTGMDVTRVVHDLERLRLLIGKHSVSLAAAYDFRATGSIHHQIEAREQEGSIARTVRAIISKLRQR